MEALPHTMLGKLQHKGFKNKEIKLDITSGNMEFSKTYLIQETINIEQLYILMVKVVNITRIRPQILMVSMKAR